MGWFSDFDRLFGAVRLNKQSLKPSIHDPYKLQYCQTNTATDRRSSYVYLSQCAAVGRQEVSHLHILISFWRCLLTTMPSAALFSCYRLWTVDNCSHICHTAKKTRECQALMTLTASIRLIFDRGFR